jgi:hypothetical protein
MVSQLREIWNAAAPSAPNNAHLLCPPCRAALPAFLAPLPCNVYPLPIHLFSNLRPFQPHSAAPPLSPKPDAVVEV